MIGDHFILSKSHQCASQRKKLRTTHIVMDREKKEPMNEDINSSNDKTEEHGELIEQTALHVEMTNE